MPPASEVFPIPRYRPSRRGDAVRRACPGGDCAGNRRHRRQSLARPLRRSPADPRVQPRRYRQGPRPPPLRPPPRCRHRERAIGGGHGAILERHRLARSLAAPTTAAPALAAQRTFVVAGFRCRCLVFFIVAVAGGRSAKAPYGSPSTRQAQARSRTNRVSA